METIKYEILLEENNDLKYALQKTKEKLEESQIENQNYHNLYTEQKVQCDHLKKENEDISERLYQVNNEKHEIEFQFNNSNRNLKFQIEQKQLELEDTQAKIIPQFDYDMLRIRIINEFEQKHKLELEEKEDLIDSLKNQLYETQRKLQTQIGKYDVLKEECEMSINFTQERAKLECQQLMKQIQLLNESKNNDFENNNKLKVQKDLIELKQILSQKNLEINELSNELDTIKEEKNSILIKATKQVDIEKNAKYQLKVNYNEISRKLKYSEEQLMLLKQEYEQKSNDYDLLSKQKEESYSISRQKEQLINDLKKKVTDLQQQLNKIKQNSQEQQFQLINDDNAKLLQQQEKYNNLKIDYDQLLAESKSLSIQKTYFQENQVKNQDKIILENEELKSQTKIIQNKIEQLNKENNQLSQLLTIRDQEIDDMQKEIDQIKNKYRNSLSQFRTNEINKIDENTLPKPIYENYKEENVELQKPQDFQIENKKLITQNQSLKNKLKAANQKIMQLIEKLLQLSSKQQQNNNDNDFEAIITRNNLQQQGNASTSKKFNKYQDNYNTNYINSLLKPEDEVLLREIQKTIATDQENMQF